MDNAQNTLVISSFILLVAVAACMRYQMPKSSFKEWYVGSNLQFDRARIPNCVVILLGIAAISALYGYTVSKNISLTLQFTGINLAIVAVAGINLILHRKRK